jgi:hypothetical protein
LRFDVTIFPTVEKTFSSDADGAGMHTTFLVTFEIVGYIVII